MSGKFFSLNRLHFKVISQAKKNIRWNDTTQVYRDLILEDVKKQIFEFKDFRELGPDLAAGFMILGQRGRVYYQDIGLISDDKRLPRRCDPNYKLKEIDANNLNIHYEGLFNFTALKHLEKLDLSFNYEMDNFCCDKLASLFYRSERLRILKLHGNSRITENGLVALAKISSLKELSVTRFYEQEGGTYNISNLFLDLFREQRPDIELKLYESNFLAKIDNEDIPSWEQKENDQ